MKVRVRVGVGERDSESGNEGERVRVRVCLILNEGRLSSKGGKSLFLLLTPFLLLVGMRRFELPTSCPPDKRANQAAPHPDKV